MSKKTVVPKLRFPEFRGNREWEKKKLEQISPSIFDGTHQTPHYIDKGIPFFSVENIVSGNKNKFISKEDYLKATTKNKPEKGDILITRIGNIGFSAIVDWDYEFSIYVTLAVIKHSEKFNSYFLNSFLQSDIYQKEIKSKSLLNAVPCKINMDELRKTNVFLPLDETEQKKIADCLSSFDDLIAAENKKLEVLRAHKKGLMQKLFPAEGKAVPEWRFPEFRCSGQWKVTTLSKVVDYENGKAHENELSEDGKYIVVNSKFISTAGEIKKYSNSANLLAFEGDILMVLSDVPNGRAIAKCFLVDKSQTYTVNQRICRLTPRNAVGLLLFYVIDKNNYFLRYDDGVKQTNLRKDDVLACPIILPKDLKEQQKIADCLSSLDDKITAQAEKIEALKMHKKGLMQGLFPASEEVVK